MLSTGKGKAVAEESSRDESNTATLFNPPRPHPPSHRPRPKNPQTRNEICSLVSPTILKRILAIYYKKVKSRERRTAILERVIEQAKKMSKRDVETITRLLARKEEITRKALKGGPLPKVDIEDEEEVAAEEETEAPDSSETEMDDKEAESFSKKEDSKVPDSARGGDCESSEEESSSIPSETKRACKICASQTDAEDILELKIPGKAKSAEKSYKLCRSCVTILLDSQIDMIQWVKLGYITSFHHSMVMRALPEEAFATYADMPRQLGMRIIRKHLLSKKSGAFVGVLIRNVVLVRLMVLE